MWASCCQPLPLLLRLLLPLCRPWEPTLSQDPPACKEEGQQCSPLCCPPPLRLERETWAGQQQEQE